MDVNVILESHVKDNKKFIDSINIFERELRIKTTHNKIISIIGPRRSGKTYYLYSMAKKCKNYLFFDFDSIILKDIDIKEIFYYIMKNNVDVVFIDEVQEKENWHLLVRSLHNKNIKVIVTGSSSKLLSKEIATQLRGRTLSYTLLPFSFKEYLKVKKFNMEDPYFFKKIKDLLRDYLIKGGFPEFAIYSFSEKILKEYVDLMFFRDFVERKNIKNIKTARFIFEFLLKNYGKEISLKNIKDYLMTLNIDSNLKTISNYLYEIEDTFVLFLVSRYSHKVHVKESWPKKIYLVDTAIAKLFEISENIGKKIENVVFIQLKRMENLNPLQEIFYYKTKEGYEVDFLIKESNKIKELIQVCYANSYEEVPRREIRALLHAKEELKLSDNVPLTVITWDYEGEKEVKWWKKKGKIRFVPLWKWLLNF